MMCSAYFGELCDARKANWEHDDTNPYGVLVSPISLENKGHDLLDVGSKYFHDRIQIDWESFAGNIFQKRYYSFWMIIRKHFHGWWKMIDITFSETYMKKKYSNKKCIGVGINVLTEDNKYIFFVSIIVIKWKYKVFKKEF